MSLGELGAGEPLPPGPYSVGLTHTSRGDSPPWTVICGTGQAIAGHVPSRAFAEAIVIAMNLAYPTPKPLDDLFDTVQKAK